MTAKQFAQDSKSSSRSIANLMAIHPLLIVPPQLRISSINCTFLQQFSPSPMILGPNLYHPEYTPLVNNNIAATTKAISAYFAEVRSILTSRLSARESNDYKTGFFLLEPEFSPVLFPLLDLIFNMTRQYKISDAFSSPSFSAAGGIKLYSEGM